MQPWRIATCSSVVFGSQSSCCRTRRIEGMRKSCDPVVRGIRSGRRGVAIRYRRGSHPERVQERSGRRRPVQGGGGKPRGAGRGHEERSLRGAAP